MTKDNTVKVIYGLGIVMALMAVFFIWQNNAIVIRSIDYKNTELPQAFEGYTIIHISDLHNKAFGNNQKRLLKKIRSSSPDIIVITGDLIDRRKYDLDTAMVFIKGAREIAPVYYVSGNHEAWSGDYKNIKKQLQSSSVEILDDRKTQLFKDKDSIEILGISDPAFLTSSDTDKADLKYLKNSLGKLAQGPKFKILLSHRPELFDLYAGENIDLIFAGHAHGGQIRLPFIGGLVAPDQGWLPAYTDGAYIQKESTLIVSRGLGNSIFPLRVFNRPQIIKVVFKGEVQ